VPLLLRSVKVQSGNRPHPISTIALTASLSYFAIGLADGTVLLYRHLDQSIFSGSTSLTAIPKPRVILEGSAEPVTGLGFREPTTDNPNAYLFIVTISRALVYQVTGKGSGGTPIAVDEVGCALGCATMDHASRDIVVARDEALYICGIEGRGACYAYEGAPSLSIILNT
jgi:vacuolar protein sorting-associated protein 11